MELDDDRGRRIYERIHSGVAGAVCAAAVHAARIRFSAERIRLGVRGGGGNGPARERGRDRHVRHAGGGVRGGGDRYRNGRRACRRAGDDLGNGDHGARADRVHRVQYAHHSVLCGGGYGKSRTA